MSTEVRIYVNCVVDYRTSGDKFRFVPGEEWYLVVLPCTRVLSFCVLSTHISDLYWQFVSGMKNIRSVKKLCTFYGTLWYKKDRGCSASFFELRRFLSKIILHNPFLFPTKSPLNSFFSIARFFLRFRAPVGCWDITFYAIRHFHGAEEPDQTCTR